LSWITDLWKIFETASTLTREVDRATENVNELRRDVNTLTRTLNELKSDLAHEKATTRLVLDSFEKDGKHLKESIDSRFDVIITRLDPKITAIENRTTAQQLGQKKSLPSLESGSEE
jgi:chromosome segregation ATPase